jgi:hypothetical protein
MEMNRRKFLAGMTAVTAAALCDKGAGFAQDPCDIFILNHGYLRKKKDANQLSISFQGTFAIFVFNDHIEAYTPNVVNDQNITLHNYWLAKPAPPQGLKSIHLFDLKSPNSFAGIANTSGPPPTFNSSRPDLSNNIDSVVSLVVPAKAPAPGKYLHMITLPRPDDIVLAGWSQKDTDKILQNQQDFCFLARDHRFIYNAGRFDPNNLTFNGSQVEPGLDFRFLSEPKDDNHVAQECQGFSHIERAMKALAQMLQKPDDEYRVNVEYCNQQQRFAGLAIASTRDAGRDRRSYAMSAGRERQASAMNAGLDGGAVVVSASRFPACQSVIIDATGP